VFALMAAFFRKRKIIRNRDGLFYGSAPSKIRKPARG
jgi:hypothetical protein